VLEVKMNFCTVCRAIANSIICSVPSVAAVAAISLVVALAVSLVSVPAGFLASVRVARAVRRLGVVRRTHVVVAVAVLVGVGRRLVLAVGVIVFVVRV
jgi:hypothetical protein